MVVRHHFIMIARAAVGYYAFYSGQYTGKTDRLRKISNRRFLCINESKKAKMVDKLFLHNPSKSMIGQHMEAF